MEGNKRYDYGEAVRVIRNVRNDGTYPGMETGDLLVRRGSVGHVRDVGTFLQDQVIYTVHFLESGKVVGCRAEELIAADEPWIESRFESRQKVRTVVELPVGEEALAEGTVGEVLKVLRDSERERVTYHVRFPGRTLQVPEGLLEEWEGGDVASSSDLPVDPASDGASDQEPNP